MLVVRHGKYSWAIFVYPVSTSFCKWSASQWFIYLYVLEHFSHGDADPHEVALWVLLKKTISANKAIRLQAIQELAENHHWHGKIHKIVAYNFWFTVNLRCD